MPLPKLGPLMKAGVAIGLLARALDTGKLPLTASSCSDHRRRNRQRIFASGEEIEDEARRSAGGLAAWRRVENGAEVGSYKILVTGNRRPRWSKTTRAPLGSRAKSCASTPCSLTRSSTPECRIITAAIPDEARAPR